MMFSIIIPAADDLQALKRTLSCLATNEGRGYEIILVARHVEKPLLAVAERYQATLLESGLPRGAQKNEAVAEASFPWLLIMHPGSLLAPGWLPKVKEFIEGAVKQNAAVFQFALEDESAGARQYEAVMRWANRHGGGNGAQGVLLPKSLLHALGGFKPDPLYEDFDLLQRLHREQGFTVLPHAVLVDAEKYRRKGYISLLLTQLSGLYCRAVGLSPEWIAKHLKMK